MSYRSRRLAALTSSTLSGSALRIGKSLARSKRANVETPSPPTTLSRKIACEA
ncbi:hypothetical protein HMPREF1586_01281 [Gardnerella vaginalis JCP8522]|nr:hypothetical protein HMPREF1586_01281 [Gardnerella vaginalis JCP8522]